MSQQDFVISQSDANTGVAFRTAMNAAFQALASLSSGATAPTTTYGYQLWMDTGVTPVTMRMRNGANTAWVTLGTLSGTVFTFSKAVDADTIAGNAPSAFATSAQGVKADAALPSATFDTEYTAANVLAKLLTVDGAGTGLDADLLDGQEGSYYRNADNLNTGTVPIACVTGKTVRRLGTHIITGTQSVTAAGIPLDDSAPLKTEGTQILSVTAGSSKSTNTIVVRGEIHINSPNVGAALIASVWKDNTLIGVTTAAQVEQSFSFYFETAAVDTANHTYTVRVGDSAGSTLRLNGVPGYLVGNVISTSLCVEEIVS